MTLRTYVFFFALLLITNVGISYAQRVEPDSVRREQTASSSQVRGVQYESREAAAAALLAQQELPLFAGVSVSTDLAGIVMAAFTPYGQYEAAARINLKGRFFPLVEIGVGSSNHTNETTNNHYKVNAPYYKIGMDYNVLKNRRSGNRIFIGARYGFTSFRYDVDGPDLKDPIYGTIQPFHYEGLKGTNHWAEAVFGLEAKVWGILRLGWSLRYRLHIYNKKSAIGSPWYVPGFGKNDGHAIGGTFNVVFEL